MDSCVDGVVDNEPDRDPTPRAQDVEHERARQLLDAQAQAWARAARKWLWIVCVAGLSLAAACVWFFLY